MGATATTNDGRRPCDDERWRHTATTTGGRQPCDDERWRHTATTTGGRQPCDNTRRRPCHNKREASMTGHPTETRPDKAETRLWTGIRGTSMVGDTAESKRFDELPE
jgi:hypothetical protein